MINYIKKNHLIRTYGLNSIVQVSSILISYIFTIYITQNLGANKAGLYFLSMSIFNFLVQAIAFGFQQSSLKIFSKHFADNNWESIILNIKKIEIFILVLGIFMTITSILFFHYFSFTFFGKIGLNRILLLILLSALPFSLIQVYGGILNGIKNHIFASLITVSLVPSLTLVLIIIYSNFSPVNLMQLGISYFIACCIVLFITKIVLYLKFRSYKSASADKIDFKSQVKFSASLQLISLLACLNNSMPILIIGILVNDTTSISYFSVASKISLLCAIPLGAISNIVAPKIAHYYHKGEMEKLSEFIQSINICFILLAIFITVILSTFAGEILSFFGQEFVHAKNILLILLLGQFVNLSAGYVGFILSMTSYHKLLLKVILLNALFFTSSNVLLIYLYGVVGAAISVSLGLCSLNIAYAICIKKKFNISILPNIKLLTNYARKIFN